MQGTVLVRFRAQSDLTPASFEQMLRRIVQDLMESLEQDKTRLVPTNQLPTLIPSLIQESLCTRMHHRLNSGKHSWAGFVPCVRYFRQLLMTSASELIGVNKAKHSSALYTMCRLRCPTTC
jgi:hypothetical protein